VTEGYPRLPHRRLQRPISRTISATRSSPTDTATRFLTLSRKLVSSVPVFDR
jgi:hypothetical protein